MCKTDKNPRLHRHALHVKLKPRLVRNLVQDGLLDLKNCHDPDQTVNALTKALPRPKHLSEKPECRCNGTYLVTTAECMPVHRQAVLGNKLYLSNAGFQPLERPLS